MSPKRRIEAPKHLSKATREWFEEIASDYSLESHHLRLLEQAASTWDRWDQARKMLKKDGIVIEDRFGVQKTHPAVAIERDARLAFARLVRELDLEGEPLPDPRVPRRGGR